MNTLEGKAWQALASVRGMGPRSLWRVAAYLFQQQRTASWLLRNPSGLREVLGGWAGLRLPDPDLLDHGEEEIEGTEATILHPLHPRFPAWIRDLKERLPLPALLYATGNLSLLERPAVSVVGRRDASREALEAAAELAAGLADLGINVTSGYAAGIDCAAHRAALDAGGTTIAVLAEGLGHFRLKPELRGVLDDENTLVISQFPPDSQWAAFRAMARNKLVAALANALVVIISGPERDDGGRMSGSFDAGISALRLGLPMFAVDPSFFPDAPAGNRELIRKGGRSWAPGTGAGPILEAMKAAAGRAVPGQKNLFK